MSTTPIVDRIRIIPKASDFLDRNVGRSGEVYFNAATDSLRANTGGGAGGCGGRFQNGQNGFANTGIGERQMQA